jgi:hypothetical protein
MNGPQHYIEAERLLAAADDAFEQAAVRASTEMAALAQVHATLALSAATAMAGINHMDEGDFREWDRVAGVQPDRAES